MRHTSADTINGSDRRPFHLESCDTPAVNPAVTCHLCEAASSPLPGRNPSGPTIIDV